jgi:hypothetical protein
MVNKVLTVCLLTQGRQQISEFIESARQLEDLNYVNFLIVDNASPLEQSKVIKDWASQQRGVTYLRREKNTTDFNILWGEVKEFASEWVVFPGDDDRLLKPGFLEWKLKTDQDSSLNVVAMPSEIIDSDGHPTNEIQCPDFSTDRSQGSSLARALHQPPFFWPSLFFKQDLITHSIPVSRFVLDWSTGVYLLSKANIATSDIPSLQYRRHGTQESNLVSSNRKQFEAIYWLDEFICSSEFEVWLKNSCEDNIQDFWRGIIKDKPLYGQEDLAKILIFLIAKKILRTDVSSRIRNIIVADLSLLLGALQYDNDFRESVEGLKNEKEVFGNLRIVESHSHCEVLTSLLPYFRGSDYAKSVSLACAHSKNSRKAIWVDCSKYLGLPARQSRDLLLRDISEYFENSGVLDFRISPIERRLIRIIRSAKPFLSVGVLGNIKRRI